MLLFKKTLSAIVSVELLGVSIAQPSCNLSAAYCYKSIMLTPWFYRYPLSSMVVFLNIIALVLKRNMFYNLSENDRSNLWWKISKYPVFASLSKLVRSLTLLSAYSVHNE